MRGCSPSASGRGDIALLCVRSAALLSAARGARAAVARCPIGYYRTAPAIFACDRTQSQADVLLADTPALVDVPAGIRDFQLELKAPAGSWLAIVDPSTRAELANTSAGAAVAVWQGVRLQAHSWPLRAKLRGSLPGRLLVKLRASAGRRVARLSYAFAHFDDCPEVPFGCSAFDRGEARDLVVHWSRWASARYPSEDAAWASLCQASARQGSSQGAVPFVLWQSVWAKWPAPPGKPPTWQAAFKFIDQCAGAPEDGRVDPVDFGVAFRLAAVTVGVSAWCQKLRAAHGSSEAAWAATGGARDSVQGGIAYGTWESEAWKDEGSSAEEAFAYVDTDGDNVVSKAEFLELFGSCNASGSVARPGAPATGSGGPPAAVLGAAPGATSPRCFAYRADEFGGGEPSAFGDVVAQQWSLFLLDTFDSRDAFTWEMPAGGASWSDGQVHFSGGGRSIRTVAALYRNTGTIVIRAAMTKAGLCDNHFVMLSTSAAESWSWRPSQSSVKFAWSCGSKYILSRKASASTACPSVGRYVLSITLDPAGALEFQDDRGCKDLVLLDSLGASGEPLYLYVGGDGPPGNSSAFDEIRVKIGINSMHNSDVSFPTATACLYDGAQYEEPMSTGEGQTEESSMAACQHRCSQTPGCSHFSFQLWSHGCDLFDGGARWHRAPGVISGPPRCIVGVQMQVTGVDSAPPSSFQRRELAPRLAAELATAASLPRRTVKDASGTEERVSITTGGTLACGFVSLPAGHSLAGIASHLAGGVLEERVQESLSRVGISGLLRAGTGLREQPQLQTSVWALPSAQCLLLGTAYGPSMPSQGLGPAYDVSTCQAQCVRAPGCTQFTFRRKSGTCHLHNSSATASFDEDAIAGPRVCPALPSVLEARPRAAAHAGLEVAGGWEVYPWIFGVLLLLGLVAAIAAALLLHPLSPLSKRPARDGSAMYRPLAVEEEAVAVEDGRPATQAPLHGVEFAAPRPEPREPRERIISGEGMSRCVSSATAASRRGSGTSEADVGTLPSLGGRSEAGALSASSGDHEVEDHQQAETAEVDAREEAAAAQPEEAEAPKPYRDHQGFGNERQSCTAEAFQMLDEQGRGRLGLDELRRFADFCGFDGTDDDWEEEYRSMCAENGWSQKLGIDLEEFQRLVDDVDGKGYCTDDELIGLLEELQSDGVARTSSQQSDASST